MVEFNGLEIGLIENEEVLTEILETLEKEAAGYYGCPVKVEEKVTVREVFLPLEEEESEKVYDQLRNMLRYKVAAKMVTVNDKDVLPLSSAEDVEKLYEIVASAFIPQKENVLLENVQLAEKISTRIIYCIRKISDVNPGCSSVRGTDRKEIYLFPGEFFMEFLEITVFIDELRAILS